MGTFYRQPYAEAALLPPSASSTSTAELYRPMGALICAPCAICRAATSISLAMATPSARAASGFCARAMRSRIDSGTETRSSFFMNSAFRTLTSGQIPAMTGIRQCSIRRRKTSSSRKSKTG